MRVGSVITYRKCYHQVFEGNICTVAWTTNNAPDEDAMATLGDEMKDVIFGVSSPFSSYIATFCCVVFFSSVVS